jgi:AcrR family transcriptional regulator
MSTETGKRRYEKKVRATQEQATRMRIVDAAIDLHGTVGPARTTISAIAEQAGVRRATVYRHFPDERALMLGCSGTWAARNPPPDPSGWGARGHAARRLRATIGLALDFLAWRTLHERGLARTEAIAVMSSAVRAAAG